MGDEKDTSKIVVVNRPKIVSPSPYTLSSSDNPEARQLWNDLKQRFLVGNKVRVHEVKARLAACRQGGQPVVEYYGRLCALREELRSCCPVPVSTCGASGKITKERDEEKIHQFVMGLDDSRFGSVCATVIGMDPLPSLGEAYLRIIREEHRITSSRSHEQRHKVVGFVARRDQCDVASSEIAAYVGCSEGSGNRLDNLILQTSTRSTVCSHSGRSGHEKREYCQLIGFSDWYIERSEKNQNRANGETCRGRGGRSSSFPGSGRGRGQMTASLATSSNASQFPEFTPEQLKVLQKMIHENSSTGGAKKLFGKKDLGDFILDTRASHHMTGNLNLLLNIKNISPCSVGFANDSKTFAISVGVFPLSDTVTLTNILYVRFCF
ncbi:hypothetical protein V5N11_004548 [Cardamine amara subsp. amara]|uniref:Retrovirus-related Pol polyprotein from transposon TNT 1-94-like beta-barrel domain-containing protein n=1 Tax=Cardamine amara subsp. amara TaxID=228776 RepID=A0ABD1C3I1_CARAN